MKRKVQCPSLLARVGLWCLVQADCHGDFQQDAINGDLKVWQVDCDNCCQSTEFNVRETKAERDHQKNNDLPGDSNLF